MKLRKVLNGLRLKRELPPRLADAEIAGLDYDSRRIGKDHLFFAFPGQRADGREFARQALDQGALAVASELGPPEGLEGSWIEVEHGRRALALASKNFYSAPDECVLLTGITGTNGKTTTSYLIDSILRAAGSTTAVIGTIEYQVAGEVRKAVNTTPESLDLYRILLELREKGGTHATMEVSSHALALGRAYAVQFHTAVFTNLTRDHLDFHATMEEYYAAKHLLFDGNGAPPPRFAALNFDDPYGRKLQTPPETRVLWYGIEKGAAVRAADISATFEGLRFNVVHNGASFPVESPLTGQFNVYNILAAYATGLSYGIAPKTIAAGIASCGVVPGRFQRVEEGQPFLVIVDYAHTDDALKNVISAARALKPNRVITLFGCGGDRDRDKRPLMGLAAAEASDFVVLTSDNPRTEDPIAIINDALVGLRRRDTPHVIEPSRDKAIYVAIKEALPGDIVIIAGKGHETYQILKDRTIHFDDREVAREVLRGFGYGRKPE